MAYGADDGKIYAVTFRVVNMAESVRFYRDVLGMEFLYGGEGTGFSSLRARDPQSAILNLEQHKPVTRCEIIPRVAASGAALPLGYAWSRTRCIVLKTISASSFGVNRRLGKPQAITATSHKLARIVYHCSVASEQYFTIFVSSS